MKLTGDAKKTLVILFVGLCICLIGFISIYTPLLGSHYRPKHNAIFIKDLWQINHSLKKSPKKDAQKIINRYIRPWVILSLTTTAKYPVFDKQTIRRRTPLQLKQFSTPQPHDLWLNITLDSSKLPHRGLKYAMASLFAFTLILFLFLCYWAVKRLNKPTKQLLEHLEYAQQQNPWQAIPLIGDKEQIAIFAKVNALQEKLQKLLDQRTQMLAAISHDLRTPLTRLKLRSEYFEHNNHYHKLVDDIADMEMMINESLDYFQDINHEEVSQQFDLAALLKAICEDFNDSNEEIANFIHHDRKIIYLGKVNLLKRAFSNVLTNAIHYGHEANVFLKGNEKSPQVIVEDRGPGLKENELKKATDAYFRSESSRSRSKGGAGLGLSIAKEIIQIHHGSLNLTNRAEGGLRVTIILGQV